jgi:SAM-dependent methyltransferase
MQWTPKEAQRLRLIVDRIALDLFHPLDLVLAGSGRGELAFELARRFPHSRIVGVEADRSDLSAARARARSSGLDRRVEFVGGGLGRIPLPSGRFGGFVRDAILFPPRIPTEVVPAEIARVLKPGGVALIAELVLECTVDLEEHKALDELGLDYVWGVEREAFAGALDDVGLTEVCVDDLTPLVRPIWDARATVETDPAKRDVYAMLLDRDSGLGGKLFYVYVRAMKPRVPAVHRDPVALSL